MHHHSTPEPDYSHRLSRGLSDVLIAVLGICQPMSQLEYSRQRIASGQLQLHDRQDILNELGSLHDQLSHLSSQMLVLYVLLTQEGDSWK